ncbi:MAG: hypothetical protein QM737_22755 [Ferruginibacter sp.]
MKGMLGKEKVDRKVKPIHFSKRKTVELIEGNDYFVSFGNNNTYPCKLIKVINEYHRTEVEIEIPMRPMSKRGFINTKGEISHHWVSNHILFADEIGLTREEAVINEVTF